MLKTFLSTISLIKNSTNVRQIKTKIKHKFVRSKFQFLSKISSTWAAREAMNLFFQTARHKRPERESKLLLKAAEKFTFNWQGKDLVAWAWGVGPTILLVHGWNGRGAQLGSFINPLVSAGYRVIAYDAPGHGDSDGKHASLVDLSESLSALIDKLGSIAGVIAHSLGTAATTLALTQSKKIPWVVYIAPPLQPRDYVHKFAKFLKASPETTSLMMALMTVNFRRSWESLDIPELVKSLQTPLLVIHDEEDKDVPYFEGATLVKAWPKAKLITTKGLGHRRILHQSEVINQVLEIIQNQPIELAEVVEINQYSLKNKILAKKCSQETCNNLVLETLDKTGRQCSACLMDKELFNPSLRWA